MIALRVSTVGILATLFTLVGISRTSPPTRLEKTDIEPIEITSRTWGLPDTIFVSIANTYEADLSVLGMARVGRFGTDGARGRLTRDGETYRGIMRARVGATFGSLYPGMYCTDEIVATQELFAVAHIERPARGLLAGPRGETLLRGSLGEFDLTFYFFPETAPAFQTPGDCQTPNPIGFEGYGRGGNSAPYPWLPQSRARGAYIPLNDTRWTTQIGLRLHAPPAGGMLEYEDESGVNPGEGVYRDTWAVFMLRGSP